MIPKNKPKAKKEEVLKWVNDQLPLNNIKEEEAFFVAVRGYMLDTMGVKSKNDRGMFDDALFFISPNFYSSFNFNTDPSKSYKKGMACLVSPQIITYIPGTHGYGRSTQHLAFRQDSDVIVRRDGGVGKGTTLGNGLFTDSKEERFWTNLHMAQQGYTSSEGCLTVPYSQWKIFYFKVIKEMAFIGQKKIRCFLIDEPRTIKKI